VYTIPTNVHTRLCTLPRMVCAAERTPRVLDTIVWRCTNECLHQAIVRWSRLRANNAIGRDDDDDGAVWLEITKWTPVHSWPSSPGLHRMYVCTPYAVIQFESFHAGGPDGLLMYLVEGWWRLVHSGDDGCSTAWASSRPVPCTREAAAMVALRKERSLPFLPPRIRTI